MNARFTMRRLPRMLLALLAVTLGLARAQIPGENVNVVTGNVFPGGDPFLQRQNEPSIAVSSANPQHLVAGANDYRTVDLPDPRTPGMTGDAWLGLYKSLDGGQTWRSTLIPGYRQDHVTCGTTATAAPADVVAATTCARKRGQLDGKLAQRATVAAAAKGLKTPVDDACDAGGPPAPIVNPACGMEAGADPVVRAGTDGLVYFAGLLFQRDHSKSKIVIARFLDTNDRENGDPTQGTDPIRYVDTVEVASGGVQADGTRLFVDKPWIAVDVPRGGGETCTLAVPNGPTRTIAAGAIYVGYSLITETAGADEEAGTDVSSDVMVRRSLDCGATWGPPVKLNDVSSTKNQGVVISVDPVTGKVYAAWRRIASDTQSDAILVSRTFSRGDRFTAPRVVASIAPGQIFDHATGTSPSAFRSRALPTLAISTPPGSSNRYLHIAWAQRNLSGWSRVVMSTAAVSPPPRSNLEADEDDTSADHWGAPAAVDDVPLTDFNANFTRGHQLMPQLTASQGRVVLVYYDSRFDHAQGLFAPNTDASGHFAPDLMGNFYRETKAPRTGPDADGQTQRFDDPAAIFNRYLDDWGDPDTFQANDPAAAKRLRYTRHTVDVRVAMATASATPVFAATQLSKYAVGFRGDEALRVDANGTYQLPGFVADPASADGSPMYVQAGPLVVDAFRLKLLRQLQANPPNLPLFMGGTTPFMGDYIDVSGPAFVRNGDRWQFNTAATPSPVFHAIWTSNQDVRPPPARPDRPGDPGYDPAHPDPTPKVHWTDYTPIKVDCVTDASGVTTCSSLFQDGTSAPQCVPGQEGSRNQNVYTSRITDGLLVSTPQNAKPLAADKVRTFVVFAQNATGQDRSVRFSLAASGGVLASFQAKPGELPAIASVDAVVPARSHVFRTVFAKLSDPLASPVSSIDVRVDEVQLSAACSLEAGSCPLLAGGASGFVTLNPPGSPALLQTPAGSSLNVSDQEVFDPLLVDASLGDANLHIDDPANANLHIGDLAGTGLSNADPGNANLHIDDPSNANLHIDTLDGANLHIADLDNANLHIDTLDGANLHIDDLGAANLHIDGLSNANLHIDNLGDGPVSDLTHWVRNAGNTTVGYDVRVVGEQPVDEAGNPIPLQLIVTKVYTTPTAFNCQLRERVHTQVEVNVPNVTPAILASDAPIPVTDLDPRATHATMVLAPGQVAQITLRGAVSLSRMARIGERLGLVSLPQGDPVSIVQDPTTCPPTGCTLGAVAAQRRASLTDLFMISGRGLAASVTDPAGRGTPTGLVTFVLDDGTRQRQLAVMSIDQGAPLLNYQPPAGMTVIAYYAGDAVYAPSEARWPAAAPTSRHWYEWGWGQGSALAVAADGSVYAGGLQKLSAAGALLWETALTQASSGLVAIDFVEGPSGDVYVFGENRGVWMPGATTLYVARVGADATLRWMVRLASPTNPAAWIAGSARAIAVDEAHDCTGAANLQGCVWMVGTDNDVTGTTLLSIPADGSSNVPGELAIADLAVLAGLGPPTIERIGPAADITTDGSGTVLLAAQGTTLLTAGNLNYVALIGYSPSGSAGHVKISLNARATAVGIAFAPGQYVVGGTTSTGEGFLAALDGRAMQSWSSVGTTPPLPPITRVTASNGAVVAAGHDAQGGVVLRVDPTTGAVVWSSSLVDSVTVSDVAIGAGGAIFATGTTATNGGEGFVAKLDPTTGAELGP